jgi:WD40 repeat protein
VAAARPLDAKVSLPKAVRHVAFSPDGNSVVTAGNETEAQVWDVRTGALRATSPAHEGPIRLARFSPDGRLVVTADEVSGARVWNAATGEAVTPPLRHGLPLAAAAFSADGKRLTTAGAGGTVCVWELSGGMEAPGSVEELAELARLLAGARIDEDQAEVRLDAARLKAAWEHLRSAR